MPKKKINKILIVSQLFYPDTFGGGEKVLYYQARGLADKGFEVSILTRKASNSLPERENIDGIEVVRYSSKMDRVWGKSLSDVIYLPKKIRELHKEKGFDMVMAHHVFSAYGFSRSNIDIPFIYIFHASYWKEVLLEGLNRKVGRLLNYLFAALVKIAERSAVAKADKLIVLSDFSKNILKEIYKVPGKKIAHIPAGVDLRKFFPADDKKAIKEKLQMPEGMTILFTVRRLVRRMGIENLLLAMKKLKEEHPEVCLFVGGKGILSEKFKKAVRNLSLEKNVRFIGFIKDNELPLYYQAADVFILPTLAYEGFGMVTLEALASGTPVLGTPAGATPEILGKLGDNYIFKGTGATDIYEGIKEFLEDRRAGGTLEHSLRYFVEENYSWKKNIELLIKEIKKYENTSNK